MEASNWVICPRSHRVNCGTKIQPQEICILTVYDYIHEQSQEDVK